MIKRRLLLGRKAVTNLDSILKSRDITLPIKVHLVKAMVFPVVVCGCESWTVKQAEHRKIDAFELCCWGRLLRVPWTARRSNQSILKEISPEHHWNCLIGRDPDDEKNWRQEKKGTTEDEMVLWHHQLDEHEFEQALGVGDWQGSVTHCNSWGCKKLDTTEQLNWTKRFWNHTESLITVELC